MTKRSRTGLFLFLAIIFFLAAPGVIFYSQGYRLDWEAKQFTQVGAFYFDVKPTQAEIFIDGAKIGETGRFIGSSLSKNLLPGAYEISIQKQGYHSWKKNLAITPQHVTEAKNILLLPTDPEFTEVQKNVQNFWFSPNSNEALLQKQIPQQIGQNSQRLVLWNRETNQEYALFEAPSPQSTISNIEWAPNSNAFLFRVTSQGIEELYVQQIPRNELSAAQTTAEMLSVAREFRTLLTTLQNTESIAFSPTDSTTLLFLEPTGNAFTLLQWAYQQNQKRPQPIATGILAFVFQENRLFWLDAQGMVWRKQSLNSSEAVAVFSNPFPISLSQDHKIYVFSNQVFVETGTSLYWMDQQEPEEIFSGVEQIVASPDGRKLAVAGKKEIQLFYMQSVQEQPARQRGEKVFLTRLSEDIGEIAWLNPYYLAFAAGDTIRISEIDTRDQRNVAELSHTPGATFFWHSGQSVLYLHSENQLGVSKKLIP